MKLEKLILTENNCYKAGQKHTVKGLMLHSTGANNPNLRRYVGPDDGILGENVYNNHWNTARPDGRSVCVHGFIGLDKFNVVRTYQTLPWDMVGWHSGSGRLGHKKNANNTGYIGVEICEGDLDDAAYFKLVYREAVELFAYLCVLYDLDPMYDIICHSEGSELGVASAHGDVMHWFPKHGKDMESFRSDVAVKMCTLKPPTITPDPTPSDSYYRVQVGAFKNKDGAEIMLASLVEAGFTDAFIKYS